jgi:hypothetical protein
VGAASSRCAQIVLLAHLDAVQVSADQREKCYMKKYKVIAKVEDDRFVKYNVNNLLRFCLFLDRKFPNWRWFNVYEYKRNGNGDQVGNFTRNNRPTSAHIQF